MSNNYNFRMKRLVAQYAFEKGIKLNPDRMVVEVLDNMIRLLIDIATQEEMVHKYPSSLWQQIKEKAFPHFRLGRWYLRRYPVNYVCIWSIHKYPEIDVPKLGKEFVSFKVMKHEDFTKSS